MNIRKFNIAGVFDTSIQGENALAALLAGGFDKDDVSLALSEGTRDKLFTKVQEEGDRVAKGAAAGVIGGATLGVLVAALGLLGAGTGGVGLLAAGPLLAMLGSAVGGATLSGFGGALIAAGFAADEANHYEAELKAGKAILIVHTDDAGQASRAREVLQNSGAVTRAA